ncbi:transposase [Cyanobacterium sp. HL-69]|uniref:transposase n=1 Tax=Cyanobacterium sp. HL-69 TaxID=2054282 RepID=UPI00406BA051
MKNTCNGGVESRGFCGYKLTNGIKRHLAVDSLGFPFFTYCTETSISDDRGLIMMLSENIDYFRAKPMNVHKITILVDSGYHPDFIMRELEKVYPQIGKKIRMEKSGKISSEQKKIRRKKRICGSQSKMDH